VIPKRLESEAFRAPNGEFAWTRNQARELVPILAAHQTAVLGGELWWVAGNPPDLSATIPQAEGPSAVYAWETRRQADERWLQFVDRCAVETLSAIMELPREGELPSNVQGRVLYNLTWATEKDYDNHGPS
jgi:hypothetical protein